MRKALVIVAVLALGVAVAVGLSQAGSSGGAGDPGAGFDLGAAQRKLAGAPAPLAVLHRDANRLLPGGQRAFDQRITSLRGHPVVINKWASWCRPCQTEFPFFQQVATERGRSVAFVGVDSDDVADSARTFLRDHPVPFPSYSDPDKSIARSLAAPFFPTTIFLDAEGRTAYIHQGQYRSSADLARDVDTYLGKDA